MANKKPKRAWRYDYVTVLEVKDGDTVILEIDMGFRQYTRRDFRLIGIDAPECEGETKAAGDAATEYLSGLLCRGIRSIVTHGPDKYGRELVSITALSGMGEQLEVSTEMVRAGHAVWYNGGKR
jgi:endonuclease YncB( thermonuclease family)